MELPFDPAIPQLELYPKNPETPIQKNLCTPKGEFYTRERERERILYYPKRRIY